MTRSIADATVYGDDDNPYASPSSDIDEIRDNSLWNVELRDRSFWTVLPRSYCFSVEHGRLRVEIVGRFGSEKWVDEYSRDEAARCLSFRDDKMFFDDGVREIPLGDARASDRGLRLALLESWVLNLHGREQCRFVLEKIRRHFFTLYFRFLLFPVLLSLNNRPFFFLYISVAILAWSQKPIVFGIAVVTSLMHLFWLWWTIDIPGSFFYLPPIFLLLGSLALGFLYLSQVRKIRRLPPEFWHDSH